MDSSPGAPVTRVCWIHRGGDALPAGRAPIASAAGAGVAAVARSQPRFSSSFSRRGAPVLFGKAEPLHAKRSPRWLSLREGKAQGSLPEARQSCGGF